MPTHFPTAQELEQTYAAYEAEMFARRTNPVPYAPRDQDERPAPSIKDRIFCPECGKRFDQQPKQVARMIRGQHRKAAHPESVEAI